MHFKKLKVKTNDTLIFTMPTDQKGNLIYDMDTIFPIIDKINDIISPISVAVIPDNFSIIHLDMDKCGEPV